MKAEISKPNVEEAKVFRCPLCGHRFSAEESEGCKACPKFLRCHLVMCPNCFYEFAPG